MKKMISLLIASLLIVQSGFITAFAEDSEHTIFSIDISKICTIMWIDGAPPHITVADTDNYEVVSEQWLDPDGIIISGDNIQVQGGTYRYRLVLNAKDGFVFDNSLDNVDYNGVEGNYSLHYEFPVTEGQSDNQTMIVTGEFNNIISASPLIDKIDIGKLLSLVISGDYSQAVDFILDDGVPFSEKAAVDKKSYAELVSGDTYNYELVLHTKEGFTFSNNLEFLYNGKKYSFTGTCEYDLAKRKVTIRSSLPAAKAAANKQLDKIDLKKYRDPELTAVINALLKAKKSIDSAKSITDVYDAVNTALKTINKQGIYNGKLPKVTAKKVLKSKKAFSVKWKKLSRANQKKVMGIEIQYARDKKFTKSVKTIKVKKASSFRKVTKLAKKKTYWIRIRTYKMKNGVKTVGPWSKVRSVRTK
ncbi:MAG: DUF1542 domain-containing protein [Mogibacterium sp.]|nr:DUF1542 domain-containing protein [Mogibacterium sp.]